MGKSKKGRNAKATDDADVDDIVNEIEGLKVNSTDNKEAGDEAASKSKKNKKKKGKKKDWDEDELLDDIAALAANDGGETESKGTVDQEEQPTMFKKDKKKKGGKKIDWGEDELLDDIADLAANDGGETESKGAEDQEEQATMSKKDKKKGKKKKKADFDEDDLMDELAEIEAEMDGGKKLKSQGSEEKEESEAAKKKATKVEDGAEGESGGGVKTAAQKKADKKEKDRKKKEKQREEARNKKLKQEAKGKVAGKQEGDGEEVKKDVEEADDRLQAEGEAKEDDDAEGEEDEGDKKKKKKKKGKGEEKEKEKKGRLGKSQLKAMQEALQKMKEDEERLKAEEEAKIKAAEEAETLRLEKLEKDREKKEREKQRKKEKKERMIKEGTYLTPTQKAAKARAEAMLAAMREQGIEVPTKDDATAAGAGPKKVRYGTRQRKKQKDQGPESPVKESAMEIESTVSGEAETQEGEDTAKDATIDVTVEGEEEKKEEEKKEEAEEVKDSWDLESEEEEEEEEEEEKDEKPSPDDKPKKEITVKAKKDEEEADDDEEEEEDEESSSEEEEESDSEDSESEEESSSESEDGRTIAEKNREKAVARIKKRREENDAKCTTDELRCPVVCVLGHVDTGKTKILDKIRHTNVQDGEAGGITQQIGATRVPDVTIREQTKMCRQFAKTELKFPGLLIIDTPGHESFSNLRSRGSSLCDIAILVVDIMHGLEPQTIESLNLLRSRKTPFIVALNKIDRLFEWKTSPHTDISNVIKKQKKNTKDEFDERLQKVCTEFAEQGMNAAVFYDNPDPKSYVSMVPTSAHSGDGMGNLIALIVELSQTMLAKRLAFSETLQCTTLEVKALPGLGTTIDVVLVNGRIREGDTMILAGQEGVITTQVRGLLMPEPLRELRVKNQYVHYKELKGAQGIKILAKDLDKALAGMPLLIAQHPDEVEVLRDEVAAILKDALKSIKLSATGVFVQASTLGSLEALLEFLKTSKIPYAGINIGPVHKRDVMKASVMLEHDSQYAAILAFDVKIEREAQEMADREGIKIFQADIIYHLFDRFTAHREELRLKKREEFKHIAVFPCKLKILPQCVFNARNPIVVGVTIEGGIVKEGTPICVPSKEKINIGVISSIEVNHKVVETARKGQEVCIKIENVGNDAPKMVGRHFEVDDMLVSKITRESIDAVKNYFREDLEKPDWQVMIELKKVLEIL